jgi:hypothetical protein
MDTREAKVQLPSYLIGDLSPKEAAMLEGHLDVDPQAKAAKDSMARQLLPVMNLPAPEVGEPALAKLFADAKRELEKPAYQPSTMWQDLSAVVRRVAAVLVVGAVLGLSIYGLTPGNTIVGQLTTANGIVQVLRAGDVIETPQGVPMTLELKSSGARVDMDGSAALKVSRSGADTVVEILRGRVIVGAGAKSQLVNCGDSSISIEAHSVAAIDYDTPFRRIVGQGAVVELQRQTIADVALDAERLYGGRIETSSLPERVAKRRISLYGMGLRRDEFLAAFKSAVERYGVTFKAEGKNFSLSYSGTAGNTADESESVLKVAPLFGTLEFKQEGILKVLSESRSQAVVVEDSAVTDLEKAAGAMKAQRMVVWAGRTDMPYFKLDATVSNYISDADRSGGKVVVASALPAGTVLTEGGLRFKSGALIKVGDQIEIALPGAKGGKLLGVMSSGIEVAKGDDANTRYFVPVSAGR